MASDNDSKKFDDDVWEDSEWTFSDKDNKIIDAWRSRPDWPKVLLRDPQILDETVDLWIDNAMRITSFTSIPQPQWKDDICSQHWEQFEELTCDIFWWCDAGPSSIDPWPITDFWDLVRHLADQDQSTLTDKAKLHQEVQLYKAENAAFSVCNRILKVAFIKAGKKPPERRGIRGRRFSEEKKEELEKKLTAYLRQNPKATREKCRKHLGVSEGYVSDMTAWQNRQGSGGESRGGAGTSLPKNMQKIGLGIAVEEQAGCDAQELEREIKESQYEQENEYNGPFFDR